MESENDKTFEALASFVDRRIVEVLQPELAELSARLAVQRRLLELLYAEAYRAHETDFDALISKLQEDNRERPAKAQPMLSEQLEDMQARQATHYERFRESVSARIRLLRGR